MLEFVHIPKTAGVSICEVIGQRHGHRPRIFKDGAHVFTCVRNPYDRAASMFYFLRDMAPNFKEIFMDDGETVSTFWVDKVPEMKPMRFMRPQVKWMQEVDRIDEVLRYETLQEDWPAFAAKNGFAELPHLNKSARPAPWQDEMTPELINIINERFADDFEQLGYERL